MNEPFNKRSIETVHSKLIAAMRDFCKKEGLEYVASNLKYTDQAFEVKVSVKQVGGLSLKEKRLTMGAGNDKNGKFFEAKDVVKTADGTMWEVFGFAGRKAIILDKSGNRFRIDCEGVELVVKQPPQAP